MSITVHFRVNISKNKNKLHHYNTLRYLERVHQLQVTLISYKRESSTKVEIVSPVPAVYKWSTTDQFLGYPPSPSKSTEGREIIAKRLQENKKPNKIN